MNLASVVRHVAPVVWLVAVWVALWRDLSWANLASGVLIAGVVIALFRPATSSPGLRIHPVAFARFVAVVAWSVVRANVVVAWEVLTPADRTNAGVVTVQLASEDRRVITLVSHAIGLAPGSMVLDVVGPPTTLYVHVLHLRAVEEVRNSVIHLEDLALAAFHLEPSTRTRTEGASG